jgi:hypothetical protein
VSVAATVRKAGWLDLDRHDIEAAGVFSRKTQSPSTLDWRLRVEVRYSCRFETTVGWATPLGLMDSRRYRGPHCRSTSSVERNLYRHGNPAAVSSVRSDILIVSGIGM